MEQKTILKYETVALDDDSSALVILDQTALPNDIQLLHLTTQKEIWNAIHALQVRGAPAIGVAAGFGIYLAAKELQTEQYAEFLSRFQQAKDYLDSARPTAVNLSWALNRMERVVTENAQRPVEEIVSLLHRECVAIKDEDVQMCRRIGEIGLTLIRDGDGILTHCNAGQLATSRYGTALAPIHVGRERGMNFHVFTDETRPLLQGARLSAFELMADGVDTTLICDNMASQVMKNGWVQAVFVGCDRVAANGDVC
ncbi:MAG TPA: S-methyl-5-thioribose-1-phosphate isomerase, partial [Candidatus Limiplasma sp.]|nr:S-methyl-5-thioribose-1-phosphate isomerase [Candidatus Limiplasma sp.]